MATRDYSAEIGSYQLKKEDIDSMVKQIAKPTYKFKQAVSIVPTDAWENTIFREQTSVLAGNSDRASVKGLTPGGNFPQAEVSWEKVSVRIFKYGLENNIPWEAMLRNDINVQARTIINLTLAVVKAVDDEIWDRLTESRTGTGVIQSFAVTTRPWDQASAAIIDDIKKAAQLISTNGNYDTSDLMCFINPRDERSIMNYIADKGAQWTAPATDALRNGNIGTIAGVKFITSNSVTASYALVVKPKTCATWHELVGLRSTTVDDPYRSLMIRVVEEGSLILTDPLAIVLIKDTQLTP